VLVLMSTAAAPLPVRSTSSDHERTVADGTCVIVTVTVGGKPLIVYTCPPPGPPFPPM
jgi:hypothetical protein